MRSPSKKPKKAKEAAIDLTKLESLNLAFEGEGGRALLNLSFSRAYDSPQISITIIDSSGNAKQALTIFDCEA